jgi:hypothetical protein
MQCMARMVRKQLYLEPKQNRELRRLARERGVPEAQVVREALDRFAAAPLASRAAEIWARQVEFMRSCRADPAASQPKRNWTREDAYRERLDRYGRNSG